MGEIVMSLIILFVFFGGIITGVGLTKNGSKW
jgi:hypothetical protein